MPYQEPLLLNKLHPKNWSTRFLGSIFKKYTVLGLNKEIYMYCTTCVFAWDLLKVFITHKLNVITVAIGPFFRKKWKSGPIAIVIVLQNPCGFFDCDCNDSWLSLSLLPYKLNVIWRWSLRQSTSLTESQKSSRSSWLQILASQLIDRFPYIRYTNHKYYLQYKIYYLITLMSLKWMHVRNTAALMHVYMVAFCLSLCSDK